MEQLPLRNRGDHGEYLIYHPKRVRVCVGGQVVHCDSLKGNQDPYVWSDRFLHTFCHATQMTAKVGHFNFWDSGDSWPKFSALYCDLVFVVNEIADWHDRNWMDEDDSIVDSPIAYMDHYQWVNRGQHRFKSEWRVRRTLKADPAKSFQLQSLENELPDIVPLLSQDGISIEEVQSRFRAGCASKPMPLDRNQVNQLYGKVLDLPGRKLFGADLKLLRAAPDFPPNQGG